MLWNPASNTDEDNLKWCWLRAVEWGNWPTFISQPIVPVALLFYDWKYVVGTALAANVLWAIFIRYNVVMPQVSAIGLWLVKLKWIACPVAAYLLWQRGEHGTATLALLWPIAIFIPGGMIPVQIGKIQGLLMQCMGYRKDAEA